MQKEITVRLIEQDLNWTGIGRTWNSKTVCPSGV
jgi:hypothetical protein